MDDSVAPPAVEAPKTMAEKPPAAGVSPLAREIARRRTFAIISHPDAGKTTLTEKLLLFGGAIQLAGQVKAKRDGRNTRSDWMAIERARGISVVTSVMTFEYGGAVFNLLDTPGHEDFSDHTYRTLTAVDSAIMVIDAARGIEAARASCSRSAACATSRSSPSSTRWTARAAIPWSCWTRSSTRWPCRPRPWCGRSAGAATSRAPTTCCSRASARSRASRRASRCRGRTTP